MAAEEYLKAVTLGPLGQHNAPIALSEYDQNWPEFFRREAARIRSRLGETALRVEHVGSTSVPGLCAKPIIDILLAVPDSSDEASYLPALEAAGYVLRIREPEWFQHRMLKGPDTDINLHVFSEGSPEARRMLRFRDRLRSCAADRELYARAKRGLALQTWKHVQDYADAKTAVILEILDRTDPAG